MGILVLGSFSYEAYHFTDSAEFCTEVCHEVMEPARKVKGRTEAGGRAAAIPVLEMLNLRKIAE